MIFYMGQSDLHYDLKALVYKNIIATSVILHLFAFSYNKLMNPVHNICINVFEISSL